MHSSIKILFTGFILITNKSIEIEKISNCIYISISTENLGKDFRELSNEIIGIGLYLLND
jgi:hypothetical protein